MVWDGDGNVGQGNVERMFKGDDVPVNEGKIWLLTRQSRLEFQGSGCVNGLGRLRQMLCGYL